MTEMDVQINCNSDVRTAMLSSALFNQLSTKQIDKMIGVARVIKCKEKEDLLRQGQPAVDFFLVASGELKLALTSRLGQEKILHILQPGDTFAEALMFLKKPFYPATATALMPSCVLAFPNKLYKSMLGESPDACFGILGQYSLRIRNLISEIEALTTHNATYRVVRYLLNEIPRSELGSSAVTLRTPKHAIASRLSITPETLSRILSKLKSEGAIEISEKRVKLRDVDKMRKFVDES